MGRLGRRSFGDRYTTGRRGRLTRIIGRSIAVGAWIAGWNEPNALDPCASARPKRAGPSATTNACVTGHVSTDRQARTNADADPDAPANSWPDATANTKSHSRTDAYARAHADARPDARAHAHADARPDAHADTAAYARAYGDTPAYANSEAEAEAASNTQTPQANTVTDPHAAATTTWWVTAEKAASRQARTSSVALIEPSTEPLLTPQRGALAASS